MSLLVKTEPETMPLERYLTTRLASSGSVSPHLLEQAVALLDTLLATHVLSNQSWLSFRIAVSFIDSRQILVNVLKPLMQNIATAYSVSGWWWLHKADHNGEALRLRVQVPAAFTLPLRTYLLACFAESSFHANTVLYEPEVLLFGGPKGIDIAHLYFVADSIFIADWLSSSAAPRTQSLPEALSLSSIFHALRSAGLDVFEIWEVFTRVSQYRPIALTDSRNTSRADLLLARIIDAPESVTACYAGEQRHLIMQYQQTLSDLGKLLNRSFFSGELDCGLKHFFVPLILFHWNRAGYSRQVQALLAHLTASELRRRVRGTT